MSNIKLQCFEAEIRLIDDEAEVFAPNAAQIAEGRTESKYIVTWLKPMLVPNEHGILTRVGGNKKPNVHTFWEGEPNYDDLLAAAKLNLGTDNENIIQAKTDDKKKIAKVKIPTQSLGITGKFLLEPTGFKYDTPFAKGLETIMIYVGDESEILNEQNRAIRKLRRDSKIPKLGITIHEPVETDNNVKTVDEITEGTDTP